MNEFSHFNRTIRVVIQIQLQFNYSVVIVTLVYLTMSTAHRIIYSASLKYYCNDKCILLNKTGKFKEKNNYYCKLRLRNYV